MEWFELLLGLAKSVSDDRLATLVRLLGTVMRLKNTEELVRLAVKLKGLPNDVIELARKYFDWTPAFGAASGPYLDNGILTDAEGNPQPDLPPQLHEFAAVFHELRNA